jgi:predicted transposase/invertase (TIGR01784 family)
MTTRTPHDAIFRDTFGQIEHARSYLMAQLPTEISQLIDPDTLELCSDHFVDEKLQDLETDLLFRVKLAGCTAFLYVLLEHQSTVDKLMIFRILRYLVRIWDRWLRDHEGSATLPPILPIVLYQGPGTWTAAQDFPALLDAPEELREALRPWTPSFSAFVDDLSEQTDEDLEKMKATALVRLVLLLLKHIHDGDLPNRLEQWLPTFLAVLQGPGGLSAVISVLKYLIEASEKLTYDHIRSLAEGLSDTKEVAMTLAEQFREEGRRQGVQKGALRGARSVLLKQLHTRFGAISDETVARLDAATSDDLERWAVRIITVDSLDEVFDNHQ